MEGISLNFFEFFDDSDDSDGKVGQTIGAGVRVRVDLNAG